MADKGKSRTPPGKKGGTRGGAGSLRESTEGHPLWATVTAVVLGAVGFTYVASVVTGNPCPTKVQTFVIQIIVSLSAAALAWTIPVPGFLRVVLKISRAGTIRAGGAIAIFVIVFLITPSQVEGGRSCDPTFNMTIRFLTPATTMTSGKAKVFLGNDQRQLDIGPNGEVEVKGIDRALIGKSLRLQLDSAAFELRDSAGNIAEYKLTGDSLLEVHVKQIVAPEKIPDAGAAPGVVTQRGTERESRPRLLSYAPDTPPAFTKMVSAILKAEQLDREALPCPVRLRVVWSGSTLTVYGRCICREIMGAEQSLAIVPAQHGIIPASIGPMVVRGLRDSDWRSQGCL